MRYIDWSFTSSVSLCCLSFPSFSFYFLPPFFITLFKQLLYLLPVFLPSLCLPYLCSLFLPYLHPFLLPISYVKFTLPISLSPVPWSLFSCSSFPSFASHLPTLFSLIPSFLLWFSEHIFEIPGSQDACHIQTGDSGSSLTQTFRTGTGLVILKSVKVMQADDRNV